MIYYNDTIIICLAQCVYAEYVGGGMVPGGRQPMIMACYGMIACSLIAGCFLYTGYNAIVNVDDFYKFYASVSGYPTQNEEAVCINEYISENEIEAFGVCCTDGYEA